MFRLSACADTGVRNASIAVRDIFSQRIAKQVPARRIVLVDAADGSRSADFVELKRVSDADLPCRAAGVDQGGSERIACLHDVRLANSDVSTAERRARNARVNITTLRLALSEVLTAGGDRTERSRVRVHLGPLFFHRSPHSMASGARLSLVDSADEIKRFKPKVSLQNMWVAKMHRARTVSDQGSPVHQRWPCFNGRSGVGPF